ncbi:MAG: type II toxin-antitoxin system PemK/MazF family toxin [Cyclobacteriaceae bacterium]|nr:type II toxin-antitoxin system PemK/MazF family toxin [Cyclobacteriaceae bacterium]
MSFSFGEIVLLKFPFTDGKKIKKRPALVLFDFDDEDVVVCRITSKFYNSNLDIEIINWEKCGLKLPSLIRLHKIATLDKSLIDQSIGVIDDTLKKEI